MKYNLYKNNTEEHDFLPGEAPFHAEIRLFSCSSSGTGNPKASAQVSNIH
jgi:hypothetical protein